ncbi:transglycosylase domain-containing protein [Maritalea myrionectae]|uniref:transglycosylase domain-containing protein n=1 Tax=Maritalea myrionectae TaxID=454601 RepID=UPI001FEFD23B|nr:penicillin-binding protein 1A [Maritalea myrionectae]
MQKAANLLSGESVQDPFYTKTKRKKASQFIRFDAWLDSSLYDFFQSLGRGYQTFSDIMAKFKVTGFRRLIVELVSDGLSFFAMGLVLMAALALPSFNATASGEFNQAEDYSVIFLDRYGNEIGRRGIRTDDSVPLETLPTYMIQAALATEDRRFYDHFGIDLVGITRAMITNVRANSVVEGGSSITQQLAKNLFLTSERTFERKIKEAFLALWLETHYTKDQILKLYFDRAYMGGGNFGVAAAAEYYFGKKVQDISLSESAMLAGLFKAPTKYAPHVDLAAARGRANEVLTNMVQAGFLTEGQVTAARRAPATPIERQNEIDSPNYFLDWAFENVKELVADADDSVSFVVRTTIDPVLQSHAEDSVNSILREEGQAYRVSEGAMVVLEPNGAVRAMVGGTDYGKSQFNRATNPERQPGSSFKPFVYATALETGRFSPDTVINDGPICIGDWCPRNYGRSYSGRVTLKNALRRSINTVPVRLSQSTGRAPIAELAHKMGIENDFPITRSLPLGVISTSVIDMASSYAVFANGGFRAKAYGISRITTLRGQSIYDARDNPPPERVLSERTVTGMNNMLRSVVTAGTGRRAEVPGTPASGKTGTTQSYRDAWFCGYTGNYVAAVWYGNDNYSRTNNLTGGRLPAQTWQKFMAYAHSNVDIKDLPGADFERIDTPSVPADGIGEDGEPVLQRPPSLTPRAGEKLRELHRLFDQLHTSIEAESAPDNQRQAALEDGGAAKL